ncbi:MAG TPA: RND transporter [Gammaproteobacteria bacterium]|nr:RND transporter [Gammaproteobacteria bacterium]
MKWLDRIPFFPLAVGALLLGLAPFTPQPHLLEKLQMLFSGTLQRPVDIFDLCLHGALPALLLLKTIRWLQTRGT